MIKSPYNREKLDKHLISLLSDIKDSKLKEAIEYSIFVGGKRIRPFLMIETAKLFNTSEEKISKVASLFEIMHCATLIDDDHPCVDNSDSRRGKPTTHMIYGDALALFAGSSMFPFALGCLNKIDFSDDVKLKLLEVLSLTFGPNRCYYGQTLDVLATNKKESMEVIDEIHIEKTGSLIEGAIECGIICSENVSEKDKEILMETGKDLGLLFQIHNDILDFEGYDGRFQEDIINNKLSTYTNALSLTEAKTIRDDLYNKVQKRLKENMINTQGLENIIEFITYRNY